MRVRWRRFTCGERPVSEFYTLIWQDGSRERVLGHYRDAEDAKLQADEIAQDEYGRKHIHAWEFKGSHWELRIGPGPSAEEMGEPPSRSGAFFLVEAHELVERPEVRTV